MSAERGKAAEYEAASYFLGTGYEVYWPAAEGGGVDLLVRKRGGVTYQRVQVKRAYIEPPRRSGGPANLTIMPVSGDGKRYRDDEFDLLCAVAADGRTWLIPFAEVQKKTKIRLMRLGPARHGGAKPTDWSLYRVR